MDKIIVDRTSLIIDTLLSISGKLVFPDNILVGEEKIFAVYITSDNQDRILDLIFTSDKEVQLEDKLEEFKFSTYLSAYTIVIITHKDNASKAYHIKRGKIKEVDELMIFGINGNSVTESKLYKLFAAAMPTITNEDILDLIAIYSGNTSKLHIGMTADIVKRDVPTKKRLEEILEKVTF